MAENDEVKDEADILIQQSNPNATKTQVPDADVAVTEEVQRRRGRILKFACLAALSLLMAGSALVLSQRFPECSPSEGKEQE